MLIKCAQHYHPNVHTVMIHEEMCRPWELSRQKNGATKVWRSKLAAKTEKRRLSSFTAKNTTWVITHGSTNTIRKTWQFFFLNLTGLSASFCLLFQFHQKLLQVANCCLTSQKAGLSWIRFSHLYLALLKTLTKTVPLVPGGLLQL